MTDWSGGMVLETGAHRGDICNWPTATRTYDISKFKTDMIVINLWIYFLYLLHVMVGNGYYEYLSYFLRTESCLLDLPNLN